MKQIISPARILTIKSWCEDLEEDTLKQAENIAGLPFAFHHISIMPDSHFGYGMPIGAVLATKGAIIPNAVGVDIGCGVASYRTNIKYSSISHRFLKDVMSVIRERVPVGFSSHKEPKELTMPLRHEPEVPFSRINLPGLSINKIIEKASYQAGTLGGGNHFIELQKDEDGFIWIMVHTGSRNVGYTIANYFNKAAKEFNEHWFISTEDDLAFLPEGDPWAQDYLVAMNYALLFAKYNRSLIMRECVAALLDDTVQAIDDCPHYDLSHNFVQKENHFGSNVWVHRKGATQARKGEACLIPGSQGSHSYIGCGLGNPESFMSCSHGAGRKMSRTKARKELNIEDEKKRLDDLGVIHAIRNEKDLDEAPSAYKDIDKVMDAQSDLVEIIHTLTPIAVIKG